MKNTLKKVIATSTALTLIIGGTVLATGQDDKVNTVESKSYKTVSLQEAKDIALKDANLDLTQVKFQETDLDEDDNVKHYELEFVTDNSEYEYDIRLSNGKILDKEIEEKNGSDKSDDLDDDQDDRYDDDMDDDQDDKEESKEEAKGLIGISKAKEIALNHVGLTSDQVRFESVELDTDDGLKVYEVEFEKGNKEFEFEINALTGQIIEFDSEIDD